MLAFMIAAIPLCTAQITETDVTVDGINYTIYSSSAYAKVAENKNLVGDYTILEKINYNGTEYPVTAIADRAFSGCTYLRSIIIPNSIRNIGDNAFRDCVSLQEITIPEATDFGSNIFYGCSNLVSVDFGNSYIQDIDGRFKSPGNLFLGCLNLRKIIIRNPKHTSLSSEFFYLKSPEYLRPGSYEKYYFIPLEELTLPYPENPISFVDFGCSKSDRIPYGENIEYYYGLDHTYHRYVFCPASLKKITYVGDSQKRYTFKKDMFFLLGSQRVADFENVIFNEIADYDYIATYQCPEHNFLSFAYDGDNLPPHFFSASKSLKSLMLKFPGAGMEGSLSTFGELFCGGPKEGLRAVTQYLENGTIKTYYIPASLEELTITEGCGMIPYGGLSGCNMLKKLSLPTSLYMVGEKALFGCAQLGDIYCAGAEPAVAFNNTFDGMRFTSCKLHVPYNSADIYKQAEGWSRFYNIQEEAPIAINVIKNIENGGVIFGLDAYRPGQTAELRAVAHSGYTFTGWYEDGALQTTADIYTFTVLGSRDIMAGFAPVANNNPVTVTPVGLGATLSWPAVENAVNYIATAYGDAAMLCPVANITVSADGAVSSRRKVLDRMSATFKDLVGEREYFYMVKANSADGQLLSQYYGTFTTGSAGVEDVVIRADAPEITGYYNLQGVRSDVPWEGMNIVVYSNGATNRIVFH